MEMFQEQTHREEFIQNVGLVADGELEGQLEKKQPIRSGARKTTLGWIQNYCDRIFTFGRQYQKQLIYLRNAIGVVGFLVYFGFAVRQHSGDEPSWRLIGITIFGTLLLVWRQLKATPVGKQVGRAQSAVKKWCRVGRRACVVRWILYVAMTAFMIVYVIIVAMKTPRNLQSLLGIVLFPLLLFLYSNNKRKVNWHTVYWGMALQFIMGLLVLKTSFGASVVSWVGQRFKEYISHGRAGSVFAFGTKYTDHPFAFVVLVQAFCIIVGMSVLTYLGVIRFVVGTIGKLTAFLLQTSPEEGINTIGNIFLHVPDSLMLVQEFIMDMKPSQLFVTYAGGLTTVGGVSLVIFMSSGVPAAPLIAASVMSAPASLAACKLVFPTHEDEVVTKPSEAECSKTSIVLRMPTSLLDAVIVGIQQSITLVTQGLAFIITFIIILEFLNSTLEWFGDRVGVPGVTVEFLFSYVFYPFAFLMGARLEDCLLIGQLLGTRTFSFAVVAYQRLGPIIQNGVEFRKYVAESPNNTWWVLDHDMILGGRNSTLNRTLRGGVIDTRSEIIATYSLCGSASFAIVGFIIGTFGAIIPHRQREITQHSLRAMVVGTVASYLTACFAGLLFEGDG